ncbi:MAG TPA: Rab family GTPase [Thermoplasmata archaeon]|nr:Rab family GTPase [Thermoplasmata archaeon]
MSPPIAPGEPVFTADTVKLKVCMAGEAAVGKTSLIRRYVLDEYDDRYVATLGTKVSKKSLIATDPLTSKLVEVHTILWDVMGTRTLRELLKEAYYHGAQGILAVADLTREETLGELDAWARSIRAVAGDVPTYVVVNKADLEADRAVKESEIDAFCHARGWPWSYTSAKTGRGVEDGFRHLVDVLLNVRADSLK